MGDGEPARVGLETFPMLEAEPPACRVAWVPWDSGFIGSGLRVLDDIVAVGGDRVLKAPADGRELQRYTWSLPGQPGEEEHWAEKGKGAGDTVALTVRRRVFPGQGWEEHEVKGTLRPDIPFWTNADGRSLIGEGGPEDYASDSFDSTWSTWWRSYDEAARKARWWAWRSAEDSALQLADHVRHKKRVDHLAKHYPGRFAETVKDQWADLRTYLSGRTYDIGPQDLDFRQRGDARAAEVRTLADKARAAFLAKHEKDVIAAFPAVHPVHGDPESVTGKLVVLEPIPNNGWVSDMGHNYLCTGGPDGWYFVDAEAPAAQRMQLAERRYEQLVSPDIAAEYAVIGRVTGELRLLVVGSHAAWGLLVEPAAATIGGAAFVDLTVENDGVSRFAGEEAMTMPSVPAIDGTASPAEVVEAMVAAVKAGDQASWKGLFATWRAADLGGTTIFYPRWTDSQIDERWVASCRLLQERIADARVVWTGDAATLPVMTGAGMPHVEQIEVELDHVREIDGTYRSYCGVVTNRTWLLQRLDGGPWRISSIQSL